MLSRISFSASAGVSMNSTLNHGRTEAQRKENPVLLLGPLCVSVATPHAHARPRSISSHAARPADLRHGPLQFPLSILHAQGGLRARLSLPARSAVDETR